MLKNCEVMSLRVLLHQIIPYLLVNGYFMIGKIIMVQNLKHFDNLKFVTTNRNEYYPNIIYG